MSLARRKNIIFFSSLFKSPKYTVNDLQFIHMNQPSHNMLWKVHFSVCFTFFKFTYLFTNPYKWPGYRESQGRPLAVQSELKMGSIVSRRKLGKESSQSTVSLLSHGHWCTQSHLARSWDGQLVSVQACYSVIIVMYSIMSRRKIKRKQADLSAVRPIHCNKYAA